jgi:hypothetical protein
MHIDRSTEQSRLFQIRCRHGDQPKTRVHITVSSPYHLPLYFDVISAIGPLVEGRPNTKTVSLQWTGEAYQLCA